MISGGKGSFWYLCAIEREEEIEREGKASKIGMNKRARRRRRSGGWRSESK
jgi:hypothetical protein